MPYTYTIDALNDICVDYGGNGGHRYNIDALNEWASLLGSVTTHTLNIDAYNEICTLLGGTGGHVLNTLALDEIATLLGGAGGNYLNIDDLNEIVNLPVGGSVSLTAPTLTWTSAETDATPEFTIDGAFQTNDIIHLYRDGVQVTTHTVTAGELAAGSVSLALTAWANGIYSVTATIERNGVESGPSDPETVTINVSNATAFKATPVFGSAPTLSNSNRTAAFTGANTTIATVAAITGKKVIAFTRDAMSAVNMGFGITAIVGNAACLGFDGQRSVVWLQNGEVYLNSVKLGTVVTSGVGGTVALVVDVPSNKAWMTKDGVNFYGSSATPVTLADVEAGIGAVSITGPTATNGRSVYAATGSVFGGAAATYQATIINGYPWAMPSGYGLLE